VTRSKLTPEGRVVAAAQALADADAELEAAIEAAFAGGATVRDVARWTGLSKSAVQRGYGQLNPAHQRPGSRAFGLRNHP